MATTQAALGIFGELAELFATSPNRNAILEFRPSKKLQKRATSNGTSMPLDSVPGVLRTPTRAFTLGAGV